MRIQKLDEVRSVVPWDVQVSFLGAVLFLLGSAIMIVAEIIRVTLPTWAVLSSISSIVVGSFLIPLPLLYLFPE